MFFFNDIQPIGNSTENSFDSIKQIDANGNEFWYARDLQAILEYTKWDNFLNVIEKAKIACQNSELSISDHFADVGKMVHVGVANREIQDIVLSRYACYLIAMNGDSKKSVIAQAQTYFAVKTHEREMQEQFISLSEDERRLLIRQDIKEHNTALSEAANNAGVETPQDFAKFHNSGYQGLYGGLGAAIGSAMFDLFGGHTQYIVFSFFIKGIAGLIVGGMTAGYLPPSITKPTASFGRILVALIIGAVWTAFGYFLAWWFVLESAVVAASKIQYSLITSAAGIVVAIVLTPKLQTVVRRLFTKN